MGKKSKKALFLISVLILSINALFVIHSISPNLPKPGEKPIFYSNQCRQDLKMTTYRALKKAKYLKGRARSLLKQDRITDKQFDNYLKEIDKLLGE